VDRELEKMFCDVGGHASKLAFVLGKSSLIIDDEKLRGRSSKHNNLSLGCSKSNSAYGPVGNCVNSMFTGIPLSCHYSHHGESPTDCVMSNLCIIRGITNNNQVNMAGTPMGGDRGYNDKEYFVRAEEIDMGVMNTSECDQLLVYKFGNTD